MGCAPHPRKSENIPKTNAQPSRQDVTTIEKENQMEGERMTKARFEDIANNDININQERRTIIKIEKMDFINKCQEYWLMYQNTSVWFLSVIVKINKLIVKLLGMEETNGKIQLGQVTKIVKVFL